MYSYLQTMVTYGAYWRSWNAMQRHHLSTLPALDSSEHSLRGRRHVAFNLFGTLYYLLLLSLWELSFCTLLCASLKKAIASILLPNCHVWASLFCTNHFTIRLYFHENLFIGFGINFIFQHFILFFNANCHG